MKVSTVDEMRNMDGRAVEEFGISQDLLMENAGQAVYFAILKELGIEGRKFLVLCGSGNNAGDGLVVARKIHSNGGEVRVLLLGDEGKLRGAAKRNLERASKIPLEISRVSSVKSIGEAVLQSDAIVDAIFGTGLAREVGGIYQEAIDLVNESGKVVFSVDIPSGVNGDTGEVMGTAVRASCTVTFGLPKVGNLLYPGYGCCGKLYVSHISFPPSLYEADSLKVKINSPVELPQRKRDAHKGDFGDVLFIAGAASYFGAPYFSALSFLKAGGGYSRLAAPGSISPFLANRGSEVVFVPQKETLSGSMALESRDELISLSRMVDMVVIGPGLSLSEETQELVRTLAREIEKPLLIDGDGITAISGDLEVIKGRRAETVLTPHLGEMSRITKVAVSEVEQNKICLLQETARDLNATIVLKGAHSLIGRPDGAVDINLSGNSGMATAGSGDVLTGTIAAMFGLGLSIDDAVRTGAFIHGLSGDMAAGDKGEDGMTAVDIMEYLPGALKRYRLDFREVCENFYGKVFTV